MDGNCDFLYRHRLMLGRAAWSGLVCTCIYLDDCFLFFFPLFLLSFYPFFFPFLSPLF
ncbi:hypothetical protein DFH27DRAFT_554448 [Peziza echinospora]|nr:hypothetical protein DFH27DRAFT_554448 [Peziza echinospora]